VYIIIIIYYLFFIFFGYYYYYYYRVCHSVNNTLYTIIRDATNFSMTPMPWSWRFGPWILVNVAVDAAEKTNQKLSSSALISYMLKTRRSTTKTEDLVDKTRTRRPLWPRRWGAVMAIGLDHPRTQPTTTRYLVWPLTRRPPRASERTRRDV